MRLLLEPPPAPKLDKGREFVSMDLAELRARASDLKRVALRGNDKARLCG